MNELALFAGAGGGILGGHLLGWRTVCAVEWSAYPASVLCARQNDGILPPFPIWDDVQTFDGKPWRGIVDVVSGGFPCQDISLAGRGAGITGARSGMWGHMARIIGEVRPRFAFVENSPALLTRGLGTVLSDLAAIGYDCKWGILGAADIGAPHQRDRIWIVATNTMRERSQRQITRRTSACDEQRIDKACSAQRQEIADETFAACEVVADGLRKGLQTSRQEQAGTNRQQGRGCATASSRWPSEPAVGRMAHGVAARVDRLKALGNGQVPRVAATAFNILAN
jgi:DNA (cytosine-5)-methyltransferase 1